MAEGLQWVFELIDKISGPSSTMEKAVKKFDDGLKQSSSTVDSYVSKLHDIVHTAQIVGGAFERLGRLAFTTFEKALQPAMFKEDTLMALETIMRDKGAAQKVFNEAIKLAAISPMTTKDTLDFTKQFILAGFGPNDALTLVKAVSDVGSMKGFSPLKMQEFTTHIGIIRGQGYLSQQQLHLLVRDGILPVEKAMAGVAKVTGMSMDQVEHAIHNKSIDSVTGIKGILTALAEMGGGKLFNLSEKGSKTMSGLLSTFVSKPFELLMNLDTSKGFDRVKGFIKDLSDVLEPEGTTGAALMSAAESMLNGITEALLGPLDGLTAKDKLQTALLKFAEFVKSFDWKALFADLRAALEGIAAVLSPVMTLLGKYGEFDRKFRDLTGGGVKLFDPDKNPLDKAASTLFGAATGNSGDRKSLSDFLFGNNITADDYLAKIFSFNPIALTRPWDVSQFVPTPSATTAPVAPMSGAPPMTLSQMVQQSQNSSANVSFNITVPEQNQSKVPQLKDRIHEAVYSVFENVAIEVGS